MPIRSSYLLPFKIDAGNLLSRIRQNSDGKESLHPLYTYTYPRQSPPLSAALRRDGVFDESVAFPIGVTVKITLLAGVTTSYLPVLLLQVLA